MSACKKCGRALRWVSTVTGQRMPLDMEPSPDGSILLLPHDRCRVVPVEERAATIAPLFKSHFATCPTAEEFRKQVRAGKARFK